MNMPEVDFCPYHALVAKQEAALVEDQEMVTVPPLGMALAFAASTMPGGTSGGMTGVVGDGVVAVVGGGVADGVVTVMVAGAPALFAASKGMME